MVDIDRKNEKNKNKIAFGTITGALYSIFGFIQIIVGFGLSSRITEIFYIPNDIIGGAILILIGVLFFLGVKELREGINEGVAFIYMGIFLALVFTVIYLLIMAADAIETYVLISEDFTGWRPLYDLRPGIYIGVLPFIGFMIWRNKFSLTGGKNLD